MDDILRWLNGDRDFKTGIDLLHKYGYTSSDIIPGDKRSSQKMFHLLKSRIASEPDTEDQPKIAVSHEPLPVNDIAMSAKRNADLLYQELQNKRAELFATATLKEKTFENEKRRVEQRAKLVRELMKLDIEVDKAYDQYYFALEHNRLPDASHAVKDIDPFFLHQRILNVRKSISRYRNKAALTAKQQNLLAAYEQELKELIDQSVQHEAKF